MNIEKINLSTARKCLLAIILGCLCTCIGVNADVFWRWGASSNIERLIINSGGKEVYSADVNINGSPGKISVFGFRDSANHWINAMHSICSKSGEILTTLLAVQLREAPILYQIERPVNRTPSIQHQIEEIPAYPQSRQAFYSHDSESNLSISVSRSNSSPADVRKFYRGVLTSSGWHLTTPATENSPSGMSAYIRDSEVACIAADRVKISGETRITLVYKKLSIK